jgi:hypothetical protein
MLLFSQVSYILDLKGINMLNSKEIIMSNSTSPRELYTRSREQYKNKNIKQYISLSSEDSIGEKVSGETCLLAQRQASDPLAFVSDKIPFESETSSPRSQGAEEGNVISERELYTRWSGISVHHVRSQKGVKIGITLQKPEWVKTGRILQITAELKRYDRLREVKPLSDDSEFFVDYLVGVKELLHSERDRTACLGRAHQRGARKAWIQDTLVLAHLRDNKIDTVTIYIEGDQFNIDMTHEMSQQQSRVYHSTGYHGAISFNRRSPRIDDLPTTQNG